MNLFQSIKGAIGLPQVVPEEKFKKWRRESTDPVIRSGACYVPIPGKEQLRFYRDKQNQHHLGRYEWACRVLRSGGVPQDRVLDCACGVGYGSARLAEVAGHVDSVDSYNHAILRARGRYDRDNISWHNVDAAELLSHFEPESFDTIVSFQTIECIEDDRKFLADLKTLLKPAGRLLIDTPARSRHIANPDNKHQRRNYSVEEWIDLLLENFDAVEAFDALPERHILVQCDFPSSGSIACCTKEGATGDCE